MGFARSVVVGAVAVAGYPLLIAAPVLAQQAPAKTVVRPSHQLDLASGFAAGLTPNQSIYKWEQRLGAELRWGAPFSARLELSFVRMAGSRAGRDASCVGVTLLPPLVWHFARFGESSLAFQFGLGGAWFSEPFPPGGTHLNGYSSVGLGVRVALARSTVLMLDGRLLHHSNGRGFVPDNPAFDSVGLDVGVGFPSWP
jgi:hypothetical protein